MRIPEARAALELIAEGAPPGIAASIREIVAGMHRTYRVRSARKKHPLPTPEQVRDVVDMRRVFPELHQHEIAAHCELGGGGGRVSEVLGVVTTRVDHPTWSVAQIAEHCKMRRSYVQLIIEAVEK